VKITELHISVTSSFSNRFFISNHPTSFVETSLSFVSFCQKIAYTNFFLPAIINVAAIQR